MIRILARLTACLLFVGVLAVLFACYSDYPVITDDRGDYSGVIRTGHKAVIAEEVQIATLYPDGSDDLFTMVYQNQYGDQKLYEFNNYDPTASVIWLDFTYCDWRYEGCEISRSWNPHQDELDIPWDYEFFPDCSGARAFSGLLSTDSRIGECGDSLFSGPWDPQSFADEFSQLPMTQFRGKSAYVVPINAGNTSVVFDSQDGTVAQVPLYGQFTALITEDLQSVLTMTPNARSQLAWLYEWASRHDTPVHVSVTYGSLESEFDTKFIPAGLAYNRNRF